jgi:peptidoglycan L-alanyl-D-glutamate endopeptidase CwlK
MSASLDHINTLHPKIREAALQAYNDAVRETPKGVHPIITDGYRTYAESDALYKLGRTVVNPDGKSTKKPMGDIVSNSKGGQSWHNFGLAIDFALQITNEETGKTTTIWDENHHSWKTVVDAFKAQGFNWGGDFAGSFKDYPHLEKKMGYTLSQLQAKYTIKDFIPHTNYVNI